MVRVVLTFVCLSVSMASSFLDHWQLELIATGFLVCRCSYRAITRVVQKRVSIFNSILRFVLFVTFDFWSDECVQSFLSIAICCFRSHRAHPCRLCRLFPPICDARLRPDAPPLVPRRRPRQSHLRPHIRSDSHTITTRTHGNPVPEVPVRSSSSKPELRVEHCFS